MTKSYLIKVINYRYLIFLILILLAYWNSLTIPFYFDDAHSIEENIYLKDISNFFNYWSYPEQTSSLPDNRVFRPLTFSMFNFCMWLGNGSTFTFHLYKLILHFIICSTLFSIWSKIMKTEIKDHETFSIILALIWAVHPALSEANVYISASSSLQAATFYFLSFNFFLKGTETNKIFDKNFILCLICFFLACFSKEEAITLPVISLLYLLVTKNVRPLISKISIFLFFGFLFSLIIIKNIPSTMHLSRGHISSYEYFLTQTRAYLWYFKLWIFPTGLNADNTDFGFSKSILEPKVYLAFLLQLLFFIFILIKKNKLPLFFFLSYYIALAPTSSFISLAEPINERRMIISYAFLAPLFLFLFWKRKKIILFSLPILITIGLVWTNYRVSIWKDPTSLWLDVKEKNPLNNRAINNLSVAYLAKGNYEKALEEANECLKISDNYVYCHINAAIIYQKKKSFSKAQEHFNRAFILKPNLASTHYFYGLFLLEMNEKEKAKQHFSWAIEFSDGAHVSAQNQLNRIRGN